MYHHKVGYQQTVRWDCTSESKYNVNNYQVCMCVWFPRDIILAVALLRWSNILR